MPLTTLGWGECLLILFVIALVAGFAFRVGFFRGRGRR